ncbi:MAG TPA: nuclear transport factor 2 family protein [Azospirillum sp.]|nr:nuclear transport factor 2 family protein [Azospirillum sp.]
MLRILTVASALSLALAAPAVAGPAADMARAHVAAIGAANVPELTAQYAPNAVFEWVGGPLDGTYRGTAEITSVWARFAGAQGKLKADVKDVKEFANPAGATVVASVVFHARQPIPVLYTLTYRNGKLANAVWQIAPQVAQGY